MNQQDQHAELETKVIHVLVSAQQRKHYDYLAPIDGPELVPGQRVEVPFGRQKAQVGVVIGVAEDSPLPRARLKSIHRVLDQEPLVDGELMSLLLWASQYYHYPAGEVVLNAFPPMLRQGHEARAEGERRWFVQAEGDLARAPQQAALYQHLVDHESGLTETELQAWGAWRAPMKQLQKKGLVNFQESSCLGVVPDLQDTRPQLSDHQQQAAQALHRALGGYAAFLLDGVTGSGKTEVYFAVIEQALQRGLQALVLVPEIALTPQTLRRFQARFHVPIAVLHSNLSQGQRLCSWLAAARGEAPIVIGTRSALFTPMPDLGLIIIDEEHDTSFKQQEGFRYHARDVAMMRARRLNIPVVLGSATPSLETLNNVQLGRIQHLGLPQRAGTATLPDLLLVDMRDRKLEHGISNSLHQAMKDSLAADQQVLIFLNRRGFSPVLFCYSCSWVSECRYCDAKMTLHQREKRLRCHHCGAEQPQPEACPSCQGSELHPIGFGTQRIEEYLQFSFPEAEVIRIDADSTRRKGSLDNILNRVEAGKRQILIGTQLLAKGHHFPNVALVGILDVDQGLFSADYRGPERVAQLITQVAGRAGRGHIKGKVFIQTHMPDHALLQTLVKQGYAAFAEAALEQRKSAHLPPFTHFALLRADAVTMQSAMEFLREAMAMVPADNRVELLGPVPAPMERRGGRFRAQLLIQSAERKYLHGLLIPWMERLHTITSGKKLRWSIDIDPIDTY